MLVKRIISNFILRLNLDSTNMTATFIGSNCCLIAVLTNQKKRNILYDSFKDAGMASDMYEKLWYINNYIYLKCYQYSMTRFTSCKTNNGMTLWKPRLVIKIVCLIYPYTYLVKLQDYRTIWDSCRLDHNLLIIGNLYVCRLSSVGYVLNVFVRNCCKNNVDLILYFTKQRISQAIDRID